MPVASQPAVTGLPLHALATQQSHDSAAASWWSHAGHAGPHRVSLALLSRMALAVTLSCHAARPGTTSPAVGQAHQDPASGAHDLAQPPQCQATARTSVDANLTSWRDGAAKREILDFVERVSTLGSADFVPQPERIAVFDNDGTLWSERPLYFQMEYAVARALASQQEHPEWSSDELMRALVGRNVEALRTLGAQGSPTGARLLDISFFGLGPADPDAYRASAHTFLTQAKHPERGVPYVDLAYLPMLELLAHLRCHEFQIYIVSGGGQEFVRAIAQELYGIPPDHVVGSRQLLKIVERDGRMSLERQPTLELFNDAERKVTSLIHAIGTRPILGVGNSDGDLPMLRFVSEQSRASLAVLLVHDDDKRETAYDAGAKTVLTHAERSGWVKVSMARDFSRVFVRNAL